MRRVDEFALVVELACLTEDRDSAEQRALLATALHVDSERASFASTNKNPQPPCLFVAVLDTYSPEGRTVSPSKSERERHDRLVKKWKPCGNCGRPVGAHQADECKSAALGERIDGK